MLGLLHRVLLGELTGADNIERPSDLVHNIHPVRAMRLALTPCLSLHTEHVVGV